MTPRTLLAVRLWPWLLAVLLLGPALFPGFVLSYDMVFVPDLALRPDFLGSGSGLPRAVPSDAVVAVLDEVVPGMLLQKLILLLGLGLAGVGIRRLVGRASVAGQLAAMTLYVWNPFVVERLGIGHWPLLLTYAALPWIFDAARRARDGERSLGLVVLWAAFGSLSAAGGVVAAIFALLCTWLVGRQSPRRVALVGLGVLLVNAPWLVAGALHGGAALSDPAGVDAFASRGEGTLPVLLTVLGLGGIWNSEVVPATRTSGAAWVALVLVVGVCFVGLRSWADWLGRRERAALLAAAAIGLAVALAGAFVPDVMKWLVASVPGGGLLRDGSRFLALLAPLEAVLFAAGLDTLAGSLRPRVARVALSTALLLAPIAFLPDAGLGLGGRLGAANYPEEFSAARTALEERLADGQKGDLLLLPFNSYRRPEWNDGRRTLDPLGRFMAPDYLADDRLFVSGVAVKGEDQRARRVLDLLTNTPEDELAEALRGEGIGWVLVDLEAEAAVGSAAPSARLAEEDLVFSGDRLLLWELPGPVEETRVGAATLPLAAAWGLALGTVLLIGVRKHTLRRGSKVSDPL